MPKASFGVSRLLAGEDRKAKNQDVNLYQKQAGQPDRSKATLSYRDQLLSVSSVTRSVSFGKHTPTLKIAK